MRTQSDAGRPSEINTSHRRAEPAPYLDWTPDHHAWMDDASCLWMLDWIDADPRQARMVCVGDPKRGIDPCPVLRQCREWVLSKRQPEQWGVWAGMTPKQMAALRTKIAA